jgi:hypothetical protein
VLLAQGDVPLRRAMPRSLRAAPSLRLAAAAPRPGMPRSPPLRGSIASVNQNQERKTLR